MEETPQLPEQQKQPTPNIPIPKKAVVIAASVIAALVIFVIVRQSGLNDVPAAAPTVSKPTTTIQEQAGQSAIVATDGAVKLDVPTKSVAEPVNLDEELSQMDTQVNSVDRNNFSDDDLSDAQAGL